MHIYICPGDKTKTKPKPTCYNATSWRTNMKVLYKLWINLYLSLCLSIYHLSINFIYTSSCYFGHKNIFCSKKTGERARGGKKPFYGIYLFGS